MNRSKKYFLKSWLLFWLFYFTANSNAADVPKGAFFSFAHVSANFCQIDGDQASGFNKFGYSFGFQVGQGIGKGWVYETGIAYSIRGARRPLDLDKPGLETFNLDYRMLDIPIKLMKYMNKYSLGAGLITTYTLNATDLDNYILNLKNDTKTVNMLGVINAAYNVSPKIRITADYQYSLNSIRISNNSNNPFFRTGVYHNLVSVGIDYIISSNTK